MSNNPLDAYFNDAQRHIRESSVRSHNGWDDAITEDLVNHHDSIMTLAATCGYLASELKRRGICQDLQDEIAEKLALVSKVLE